MKISPLILHSKQCLMCFSVKNIKNTTCNHVLCQECYDKLFICPFCVENITLAIENKKKYKHYSYIENNTSSKSHSNTCISCIKYWFTKV